MEVMFYHLQRQPLEKALPLLLEKTRERGWRAVVEATSPERCKALDDVLWTYSERSFLAHGLDGEPDSASQPILIGTSRANGNAADVRFLVDGARWGDDLAGYQRLVLIFDGEDPAALAAAREDWKAVKAAGLAAGYWQQTPEGRWEKKA
jgi:DNA polymerase-3 subunit chi